MRLMYAYKMTGHFAIYRSADAAFIQAQVPLYAREMFTTAISLDYRHRRNHRLVRHMISQLDRGVAAIETDSGARPSPGGSRTSIASFPTTPNSGAKR